jgi:hypothetical protein
MVVEDGTLLNPRHEVGVVEHDDGSVFAVAALTESEMPAAIQPTAKPSWAKSREDSTTSSAIADMPSDGV